WSGSRSGPEVVPKLDHAASGEIIDTGVIEAERTQHRASVLTRHGRVITNCKARAVDLDREPRHLHDLAVGHAAFAQTPFRVEVWIVEEVDGRVDRREG